MPRLHFDILEDLSDDLELCDYFYFISINDLTYESNYRPIRRAMFYVKTYKCTKQKRPIDMAVFYRDLDAIVILFKTDRHIFTKTALRWACTNGSLDIIKWAHDVVGIIALDLLDYACKEEHYHIMNWLHSKGFRVKSNKTISFCWGSLDRPHSNVFKWLYDNDRESVLCWMNGLYDDKYAKVVKWIGVHCDK